MLTVVSSNPGKLAAFARYLPGVELVSASPAIVEPQSVSLIEIAEHKARAAHKLLGRPVVVEDGGLIVDGLGGWPGALTKPFLDAVGVDGLLRLAGELPVRAWFFSAVSYCDAAGTATFAGASRRGHLVAAADVGLPQQAWSPLWQCFQPDGHSTVLAGVDYAELLASAPRSAPMPRFAQWFARFARQPRRPQLAAIVGLERDGRLLAVRTRSNPHQWQPIGGTAEPVADDPGGFESGLSVALREVAEETGWVLDPGELEHVFDGSDAHSLGRTVSFFWAGAPAGGPVFDHDEFVEVGWFTPAEVVGLDGWPLVREFFAWWAARTRS